MAAVWAPGAPGTSSEEKWRKIRKSFRSMELDRRFELGYTWR